MLHEINLLSWREQQRIRYQRRFVVMLVIGVIVAVIVQWLMAGYLKEQKSLQAQRNQFLTQHIAQLDIQLAGLANIEKQHESILTRLEVVQELQNERNKTTDLLTLIPKLIPQGVYINKIRFHGRQVDISGLSDSTARLATMLDNFEDSAWLADVNMHSIVAGKVLLNHELKSFKVSFRLLTEKEL